MPEKTYREREIEIWPGNGKIHLPARNRNWESGGLFIPLVSGLGSGTAEVPYNLNRETET